MSSRRLSLILSVALCVGASASPVDVELADEAGVQRQDLTLTHDGVDVLVTFPLAGGDGAGAPLLLFLHGGDRSNTRHHPRRYATDEGIDFPFVVVAPHCITGCRWDTFDFDGLLRRVVEELDIDRERIYLTGYSMGGFGSWSALSRSPDWFAAAAPIAGGGSPEGICAARIVAVRAYHGDADGVIPIARSEEMVDALQACGGDAELIVYPGVGHGSWPRTYRDPVFYSWLLEHRRDGH